MITQNCDISFPFQHSFELLKSLFAISIPSIVHCTVYSVHCTLYSVQCIVYSLHCTLYSVQRTVHIVQCTVYIVHCTVYSVPCTVYSLQRTVYTVQRTVYTNRHRGRCSGNSSDRLSATSPCRSSSTCTATTSSRRPSRNNSDIAIPPSDSDTLRGRVRPEGFVWVAS